MKRINATIKEDYSLSLSTVIKTKLQAYKKPGDKITIGIPPLEMRSVNQNSLYFALLRLLCNNIGETTVEAFLGAVIEPLIISHTIGVDLMHEFFKALFGISSTSFDSMSHDDFTLDYLPKVKEKICVILGITEEELDKYVNEYGR